MGHRLLAVRAPRPTFSLGIGRFPGRKCVRGPCVPVTNPIASPQNPCSDRPSARQLSAKLESCCEGGKIVEGGCDGGGGGEEDEGKMMKRKGIQSTRGRRSRAARWKQLSLSSSPLPMRRPPPPGVAAAASGEKREDSDRENNEDGPMKDGSESRLSSVQLPVQAQAATATATAGLHAACSVLTCSPRIPT